MQRVQDIAWDPCLLTRQERPEIKNLALRELGFYPAAFRFYAPSESAIQALIAINLGFMLRAEIEENLSDLIKLVVSQDNSCRFCFAAQRGLMRLLGTPESKIRQLEQDFLQADISEPSKLAIDFARRLSRCNPPPDAKAWRALNAAGFSDRAILEMAGLTAVFIAVNRTSTLPALPPLRTRANAGSLVCKVDDPAHRPVDRAWPWRSRC